MVFHCFVPMHKNLFIYVQIPTLQCVVHKFVAFSTFRKNVLSKAKGSATVRGADIQDYFPASSLKDSSFSKLDIAFFNCSL